MSIELDPAPLAPIPLEPAPDTKRERRRRRRERNSFTPDPVREATRARKRLVRRFVTALILLGLVAAAIVPITLWSRYSTTYVTSRNAAVKGAITHVGAQISGVLASVEVNPGDHVQAGQVLARFEDHQLQANLQRVKARLNEATARSSSSLARIDAAQSQKYDAEFRYNQRVPLAKMGAISQDELRNAQSRFLTAEANERTARAEHNASGAEISTAEAELALAHADLEASVIHAPQDGRVLRRISEPGASVVVGQPIVDLWIGKGVWVEAWIDEDLLSKVQVGNDVKVTINSFPGRVFHGKVESIGASTDFELPESAVPQSRNERMRTTPVVPLRVRLDDQAGLFPGLSAVVAIERTGAKK